MGDRTLNWGWRGCRTCSARSAHPRGDSEENLCPQLLVRVVSRRAVLLCGREGVCERPGEDARDPCTGWQVFAGSARFWDRLVCPQNCPPGYQVDRAWLDLARA